MPGGMLRQHTTDAFQIALDIVDRWFAPFPLRRSRHPPASPQTTKTSARVGADLVMSVSTEHRPVAPPDGALSRHARRVQPWDHPQANSLDSCNENLPSFGILQICACSPSMPGTARCTC